MILDLSENEIDYIDNTFRTSSLNVYDYYTFYGLVSGRYSNQFINDIEAFIHKHQLQTYRDTPICELDFEIQLVVRVFITRKKRATLLKINDFDGSIKAKHIRRISEMLNAHCSIKNKSCLMIDSHDFVEDERE